MRFRSVFVAVGLAGAGLALVPSVSASADTGPRPPAGANLVINTAQLQSSISFRKSSFTTKSCSYVEGSITGTGKRALMRFDVSAANRGTAAMELGSPVGSSLFQWGSCHAHYHFSGYAVYELFRSDPRVSQSAPLVVGRKQAFCLEDYNVDPGATVTPGPAVYTCSNQGISVGWADTYGSYLDGQWLDVTGVVPGSYWLRVIVNPYNVPGTVYYAPSSAAALAIPELDYTDNTAVIAVTIPRIR